MQAYTWDREAQQPNVNDAPTFDDVIDALEDEAERAIVNAASRILRHMVAEGITLIPSNIPAAPSLRKSLLSESSFWASSWRIPTAILRKRLYQSTAAY